LYRGAPGAPVDSADQYREAAVANLHLRPQPRKSSGSDILVALLFLVVGVGVVVGLVWGVVWGIGRIVAAADAADPPHGILITWGVAPFVDTQQVGRTTNCEPTSADSYLRSGVAATLRDSNDHLLGRSTTDQNTNRGYCKGSVGFEHIPGRGPYVLELAGHRIAVTQAEDHTDEVVRGNPIPGSQDSSSRYYDIGFLP
jgi:hypothetical protein